MLARRPYALRLGHTSRNGAAVVAALALLLQMLFAVPVALQMVGVSVLGEAATICTQAAGARTQPMPQHPVADHMHCSLCNAQGLPLAPVPPVVMLLVVLGCMAAALPSATGPPAALRRFEAYAPRAPPALA